MDPYKVLGVSPSATDEEIKQAYRDLVKKYHPDKHRGTSYESEATEKLKQINEAYDMLKNRDKNGNYYQPGAGQTYTGGTSYHNTGSGTNYAQVFAQIRQLLAHGRYSEAEVILRSMNIRSAEWYYLMGNVYWYKGWQLEARNFYQQACVMEPSNEEYRTAFERCQANNYTRGGYAEPRYNGQSAADDMCRCCAYFYAANCCCECMGGRFCC